VSTKYKHRRDTFGEIADYIERFISHKIGNYLVFFPSYQYLSDVSSILMANPELNIITQTKDMKDDEKDAFLDRFVLNPTRTTIGLAVLGGAFSEGIDLAEDRLIGAVIIGVGLPQLSFERDLIRHHYDKNEHNGFEFSYVNPGMNRVMQAVGRVIRSETDRGTVLLIDDRYLQARYRNLFKQEWTNYQVVTSAEDIDELVAKFWSEK
jgi:DNA excision repair protein ERCC-2